MISEDTRKKRVERKGKGEKTKHNEKLKWVSITWETEKGRKKFNKQIKKYMLQIIFILQ